MKLLINGCAREKMLLLKERLDSLTHIYTLNYNIFSALYILVVYYCMYNQILPFILS